MEDMGAHMLVCVYGFHELFHKLVGCGYCLLNHPVRDTNLQAAIAFVDHQCRDYGQLLYSLKTGI
jgi:hypothetical protein